MPLGKRDVKVHAIAASCLADRLRVLEVVVRSVTALAEPVGMAARCVDRDQRKGGQGRCCEGWFDLDLRHVAFLGASNRISPVFAEWLSCLSRVL